MDPPDDLTTATLNLLTQTYQSTNYDQHLQNLKTQYNKAKNNFWHNLFDLFPSYSSRVKDLTIISTAYGSISSFSLAKSDHSSITIYIRQDATLYHLLWSILASLFRNKMQNNLHYTWEEIEATIDWIANESILCTDLPKFDNIAKQLKSSDLAAQRQNSEQLYSCYLRFCSPNALQSPVLTKSPTVYGQIYSQRVI